MSVHGDDEGEDDGDGDGDGDRNRVGGGDDGVWILKVGPIDGFEVTTYI